MLSDFLNGDGNLHLTASRTGYRQPGQVRTESTKRPAAVAGTTRAGVQRGRADASSPAKPTANSNATSRVTIFTKIGAKAVVASAACFG